MIIRTIFASKKQIRKWDDDKDTMAYCTYSSKSGEYQMVLPYKVSTRTRLHELGHCILEHPKHCPKYTGEYMFHELESELWVSKIYGKPISIDSILNIAAQALQDGDRTNFVFNYLTKALNHFGHTLDKQRRSNLWHGIRDLEKLGGNI